jgi:hypothetical protein
LGLLGLRDWSDESRNGSFSVFFIVSLCVRERTREKARILTIERFEGCLFCLQNGWEEKQTFFENGGNVDMTGRLINGIFFGFLSAWKYCQDLLDSVLTSHSGRVMLGKKMILLDFLRDLRR